MRDNNHQKHRNWLMFSLSFYSKEHKIEFRKASQTQTRQTISWGRNTSSNELWTDFVTTVLGILSFVILLWGSGEAKAETEYEPGTLSCRGGRGFLRGASKLLHSQQKHNQHPSHGWSKRGIQEAKRKMKMMPISIWKWSEKEVKRRKRTRKNENLT